MAGGEEVVPWPLPPVNQAPLAREPPQASPGWQQPRLQGRGLGGAPCGLPGGVSPQESSGDGRTGRRRNASRPGSRPPLSPCCRQTSASLRQGRASVSTPAPPTPACPAGRVPSPTSLRWLLRSLGRRAQAV